MVRCNGKSRISEVDSRVIPVSCIYLEESSNLIQNLSSTYITSGYRVYRVGKSTADSKLCSKLCSMQFAVMQCAGTAKA